MNRQLVANYVRCRQCGTVLQSLFRHDYKTCLCDNKTIADGGLSYIRFGGKDLKWVEPIAVYDDEPFEKVRQHMYRIGYGRDMKGPFHITRLFEMTDGHLEAMKTFGCADWQKSLIEKEKQYREDNNISVVESGY